jgi:hypothetical protein
MILLYLTMSLRPVEGDMKIGDLAKSDLAEHHEVASEAVELTDEQLENVVGGMTREKFEDWRVDMINEHASLFNSKKSM